MSFWKQLFIAPIAPVVGKAASQWLVAQLPFLSLWGREGVSEGLSLASLGRKGMTRTMRAEQIEEAGTEKQENDGGKGRYTGKGEPILMICS